jgi:carboxymethylenebutenolidase
MPTSRSISVTSADGGTFDASLTVPDSGRGPGVLLLQEIFGVNDFIEGKALDLAELGYVVLAPDVFWRVEPGLALPHDEASLQRAFGVAGRYSSEVPEETKTGDLLTSLAALRALDELDGRAGVMGYCLGGFLTYLLATAGDPDVAVSYYGSGIASMLDRADRITCPILFHFGASDPYIPGEQIEAVRSVFEGRPDAEVRVEPEAGHAFENLLAPQFADPDAAGRSWAATVDWLGRYLPVRP